ncbi:hypothetical protein C4D60_Mb09t22240 [Musa balbisiana]|uniref:D-lactate dehydrogenase (cytochrome) n=1 Tax=Musa balbisiana TaxID=52838 RepID=A0A4S8IIZ3_MUSBA|nr:hypothetical protein C4D60_Mb09t22240 [Musa balbisiana]
MAIYQVSRVELLDEVQVKAINIANGKNLPEVPTLMFEFIGTDSRGSAANGSNGSSRERSLVAEEPAVLSLDIANGSNGSSRRRSSMVEEPTVLSLDSGRNCTWSGNGRKLRALARPSDPSIGDKGRLGPLCLQQRQQQKVSASALPYLNRVLARSARCLGSGERLGDASLKRVAWSTHEVLGPRLALPKYCPYQSLVGLLFLAYTFFHVYTSPEAYAREQTLIVRKIVSEHNGSDFVYVENADDKDELWKIRKEALWACYAMAPNNYEAMTTDVCVPLSRLAECISKSKQELDASSLLWYLLSPGCLTCCIGALSMVIAHAGDGNFHTIIMFDPEQEEQRQEAERLNHFMVHTALSLEGTCTGEHGVGTGKMKYLEKELGSGALRTMKRIKSVLDPNDIMNPGKLIPPHVCI